MYRWRFPLPLRFDFFERLPIQIEVSDAPLTSVVSLLPLRRFDERIGPTLRFAPTLDAPRDPELVDLQREGQAVAGHETEDRDAIHR
jgi:hypothetical protein